MRKNEETRLRNLQAKQAQGKQLKPLDLHYLKALAQKQEAELLETKRAAQTSAFP
jgi:hypothetical protein